MRYPPILTATIVTATLALAGCGEPANDDDHGHSHDDAAAHEHDGDADHAHDAAEDTTQAFYVDEADDAAAGDGHDHDEGEDGHAHEEDEHSHDGDNHVHDDHEDH